ncbi:MAG: alpha/beta hydrolase family protein [Myxococcota bacterium]
MTSCFVPLRASTLTLVAAAVMSFLPAFSAQAGESMETLIPASGIEGVLLSPTGSWVAASATRGQLAGLLIQRVGQAEVHNVLTTRGGIRSVQWIGPNALIATLDTDTGRRRVIQRFEFAGGKVIQEQEVISAPGWLVGALPLVKDTVVWAFEGRQNTWLRRVQVQDLVAFVDADKTGRFATSIPGEKVASSLVHGREWVLDREGNARAYLLHRKDRIIFFAKKNAKSPFRKILEFEDWESERQIKPVAVAADGESLLVFAYAGHDTIGLHEFDVQSRRFGPALLIRPDADIKSALIDQLSGEVIAGVFELDGQESHQYLEGFQQKFLKDFKSRYAQDEIRVISGTLDRRLFVYRVAGPTNPGDFYLRDRGERKDVLIAQSGSLIDRGRLAPTESLVVESEDGTEIEAYLTMPSEGDPAARHPLIVMPHGGPIGVRDNRSYDPLVQYFASWGFAVLQPNYRGSGGYGREFERAGRKQWARGIEDDIDAAVEAVLARQSVDPERICIAGGSYGGFSALASVVRHRDRYRCAVSWNGVSDIPLVLDSSDIADSEKVAELFSEIAGDVEEERAKMVEASPVYHVDKIETPVFVLYGTEDRRVDPDHSHRVLLMMETLGKPFEVLEVDQMAHSPSRTEFVIVARSMRRFLTRYLNPGEAFVADPETTTENEAEFQPRYYMDR